MNPPDKHTPAARSRPTWVVATSGRWLHVARGCLLCLVCVAFVRSDAAEGEPRPEAAGGAAAGTDVRQALARTVIERNVVTQQLDSLQSQRWLILGYAALVTLFAVWLVRRHLLQGQPLRVGDGKPDEAGDHANAVITVRSGETQREVVTARVTTRKLFGLPTTRVLAVAPRAVPRPPAPNKVTTVIARRTAATPATAVRARSETTEYTPSDTRGGEKAGSDRPLIVEEFADLDGLADAPVADSDHTRVMRRKSQAVTRSGLSLLEIIIALSILATVLASVSGGIFALTNSRQAIHEDLAVSDVMRLWSERLMGADWDWLGRQRVDDSLQGAWSWQRPEVEAADLLPGDHPPLSEAAPAGLGNASTLLLSGSPSGVQDLRLFLEYYRPAVMDACLVNPVGSTGDQWAQNRQAYRLAPPIDLRQQSQAVVIRIVAHWRTMAGGQRQRELLFARRK